MIPTESQEQQAVMEWAEYNLTRWPELALLHAIPNGGLRHKATAVRMAKEGVKKGVPDLCLPVPKNGYHGLYIEMKRTKGGRLSPEQAQWLKKLSEMGYAAEVCKGCEEAIRTITEYIFAGG